MPKRLVDGVRRFGSAFARSGKSGARHSHSRSLVLWGSALFLGAFAGGLVSMLLGDWLREGALALRAESALVSAPEPLQAQGTTLPGTEAFVEKNPFGVLARRAVVAPPPNLEKKPSTLDDVQVEGTIASVVAFVSTKDGPMLLVQGDGFRSFFVRRVVKEGVLLSGDLEEVFLPLVFVGGTSAMNPAAEETPFIPAPDVVAPTQPIASAGAIKPPDGGKPGYISQETINDLLMNPFDELKKVRIVPKMDESGKAAGLEVLNLEPNSVLGTLGVKPGDVVRGINGIEMNNMGDVANAINSLMGGKKFDVSLVRDGKQEMLSYVVK